MRRNACDFDPPWFRLFVRTLGLFPLGTRVRLHDQSLGIVTGQGPDAASPIVQPISGPHGAVLAADMPEELQVGARFEGTTVRIREVVTLDRNLFVPDPDMPAEHYLTQTAHGACLPQPNADK